MKQTVLLLLLLGFSSLVFAQDKHQFGFVAKVGNYAFPGMKADPENSFGYTKHSTGQDLGSAYTLGVWHSFSLGQYFRLTSELLYRNAHYTAKEKILNYYFEGTYRFEQSQNVRMSSFSIPVKLEFLLKKKSKLSFSVGSGLTMPFAAFVRTQQVSQAISLPENRSEYSTQYTTSDAFALLLNLNAGMYYRIDSRTSIGLEYNFEKPSELYTFYDKRFGLPTIDCFCYYINPVINPKMNSFSLALRHNILAKN